MVFKTMLIVYLLVPPTQGSLCTRDNPDFDALRYSEDVPHCARNVTIEKKIEICKRDGIEDRSQFTVDHIIPLSLGGDNSDENLWCQHYSLAVTHLEQQMYLALSRDEITQQEAIATILRAKFKPK
jgi:hypothetical protein